MTWQGEGPDPWLPARLDARVNVAEAEASIRRAFWAALSRWLVETGRRVLAGSGPVNLDAVWARAPMWREAVDAVVQGEIKAAMALAYRVLLGEGYPWDSRPFVARYLAEVRNRMVRTPDEVYDLVAGQVAQAVNLGEGIPKIRDRIDETLSTTGTERWPNRATVVARTECLPGAAVIDGAYATSAYRRAYSGPMVTVKSMGGREFTGTPNHPVLTPNGWIGLGQLLVGDYLLCDSKGVKATGAPGDQNVDARQTTIAEVFDAAQAVGVPCRERTAEPDFHGDGQDGYVDIFRSFGVLPVGRFTPIGQGSVDLLLPPSDAKKIALACLCAPFARSVPVDKPSPFLGVAPADSRTGDDTANGLQVRPVHPGQRLPGLPGPVPLQDLGLGQVGPESRALTTVVEESLASIGQRPEYSATEQHEAHLVRAETGLSGHLPIAQPGEVELDKVVSIKVRDWSGHVYNLTTIHGYFVSGGIYTGNTIGALNAGRYDAFQAVAEEEDQPLEKVWLATTDSRTRHSHREADGQRVSVGGNFTVGGFSLAFPGDPSGPPQEIIQCRCSMLLVEPGEMTDMSNRQFRRNR